MPPGTTPHRTPLRRISQGSLFALSHSDAFTDAPHGLGFLEPAMAELLDETDALTANVEGLKHLSDSLATFNESFASFLYAMNMNALTTDWPQAPTEASFELAKRRAEEGASAALSALQAKTREAEAANRTAITEGTELDTTYAADSNVPRSSSTIPKPKKKSMKPTLSAKEKKERSMLMEKVVSCLPLEFRGSDPTLRRHMETVIETLVNNTGGVKLPDIIKPPDLTQARVNKCLVALVNRKVVAKENSTGVVLYHWHGLPM